MLITFIFSPQKNQNKNKKIYIHAVMNLAKCLNQKTFLFEILILLLLLYINIQQPTFIDRD